ncbi:MAG: low molecular weight phosphatase family protein [Bauldia sp.]|nr:low molecular weight phosphatase family protein [Bauldia sp.]
MSLTAPAPEVPARPDRQRRPSSVLFVCNLNSIRSPMAAAIARHFFPALTIRSAGVRSGEADPFAAAVMQEIGLDIGSHRPVSLSELEEVLEVEPTEFDLIVTLSPEAHHAALELTRTAASEVEYWPTMDPTGLEDSREQVLAAYRGVRDALQARIEKRFA